MRILFFLLISISVYSQHAGVTANSSQTHQHARKAAVGVARVYYISDDGVGNGLTSGTPAPVSLIEGTTWATGDIVYFNRGDVFYTGGIVIAGVDNVTVTAYGSGADPILYGSDYVGNETFTSDGEGNYYLSYPDLKWVYDGNRALRQGQTGWLTTANAATNTRTLNTTASNAVEALPGSIVGATMYGKEYPFRLTGPITVTSYNSTTNAIGFTGPLTGVGAGMPVFLTGQKQLLNLSDDWFYDAVADRLYIKNASTPTGRNIHFGVEDFAFKFSSCSNVIVSEIDFRHYQQFAINIVESPSPTVTECHFQTNRSEDIRIQGDNTTNAVLSNSASNNVGGCSIVVGAIQTASITNWNIDSVGIQESIGFPFLGHATGGTAVTILPGGSQALKTPNTITVDHCTFTNLGYQGIHMWGPNHIFTNNVIHDFCKKWPDGGGIHVYNLVALGVPTSNILIENNLIYNSSAVNDGVAPGSGSDVTPGIYHDGGVNDVTSNNNVVFNTGLYGLYCNFWTTEHTITNNILSGDKYALIIQDNSAVNSIYAYGRTVDNIVTGNVLTTTSSTGRCLGIIQWNGDTSWDAFQTINNNHYVQPYSNNVAHRSINGSTFTNQTFAAWQTYTGGDGSSTSRTLYKGTPDADDILVEWNPTDSPVNFNTPGGYSDYSGNAFSNPVSIPAFYGLMYFQN